MSGSLGTESNLAVRHDDSRAAAGVQLMFYFARKRNPSESHLQKSGEAYFAPKTLQNGPAPGRFRTGSKSILLCAVLCTVSGCVTEKRPPKLPRVTVDAETWADGSNKNVVARMKRERQQHVNRVLEERRDLLSRQPTAGTGESSNLAAAESEDSLGSAFRGQQQLSLPADAKRQHVSENKFADGRSAVSRLPPTRPNEAEPVQREAEERGRSVIQTSFTSKLFRPRGGQQQSSPTAKTEKRPKLFTPFQMTERIPTPQPAPGKDVDQADDCAKTPGIKAVAKQAVQPVRDAAATQPSATVSTPHDLEAELRVKGIIMGADRTRVALLEVGSRETVLARSGDSFEVVLQGTRTTADIVGIEENSVRVRVGSQEKIKVIR